MRAIEYHGAGGVEVLVETERPTPVPGPGEVLIKVAAFGLNRADVQQRIGVYPPPPGASDIPGLEVSGTIEAVGAATDGSLVGKRVCALLAGGGYAQYVVVPADHVLEVPDSVDLVDAAGFMEVAATVVSNIFLEAKLQRGQSVLIHGGAGGIGSMAINSARPPVPRSSSPPPAKKRSPIAWHLVRTMESTTAPRTLHNEPRS